PHLLHAQGGGIIFDDYRDHIIVTRIATQNRQHLPGFDPLAICTQIDAAKNKHNDHKKHKTSNYSPYFHDHQFTFSK
ncbi:MAG: hypothetical protein WCL49_11420, partial [bacterium]